MNEIKLRPISDLLGKHFFIPSYQRGYRWTESQVKALLKDIWDFIEDKDSQKKSGIYCLQPIVVKKKEGEDVYEVIDGQQRLTTIYLILKKLEKQLEDSEDKNLGSLKYATRDTQHYLDNVTEDKKEDNIDFFHVYNSNKNIQDWFKEKSKTTRAATSKFVFPFLDDVHVIWYEVTDGSDSIDIFTRLNLGKIPLTNGELIKALFLRKGNFNIEENGEAIDAMYLKQIQIASEWDKIENQLQENDFWYFIYNIDNSFKYSTRIEYLFDLMKGRKREHEERYTFIEFDKDFRAVENQREDGRPQVDKLWLEIKQYFNTLKEWYNKKEWFHLIGFLIASGVSIDSIKQLSSKNGKALRKDEFTKALENRVKKVIKGYDLEDLRYQSKDMRKIRTVLLLFNIETLNQNKSSQRFPFDLFKKTKEQDGFDVEHIRSQTDEEISKENRKEWVGELLSFYTGVGLTNINDEFIANLGSNSNKTIIKKLYKLYQGKTIDDSVFENIFKKIAIDLNEDENTGVHGLGNLALLNTSINRSYKNIMFPLKRRWLLKDEEKGKYIPLCTKNVFMKAYSKKMDSFMYWQNKDAEDYLEAIKTTLHKYL